LLVRPQNVDAEAPLRLDLRPAAGVLAWVERDERRVERDRGERPDGEGRRCRSRNRGRDDDHAGGVLPEHLTELLRGELVGHGTSAVLSSRLRVVRRPPPLGPRVGAGHESLADSARADSSSCGAILPAWCGLSRRWFNATEVSALRRAMTPSSGMASEPAHTDTVEMMSRSTRYRCRSACST